VSVNGVQQTPRIEPRVSLLDFLREHLDLTGHQEGVRPGCCRAGFGRRIIFAVRSTPIIVTSLPDSPLTMYEGAIS
jgi:aerobic-type carbon monoxide dehydrogenase small subunit (CoxS/CutS family)